jgi:hypothetical protein
VIQCLLQSGSHCIAVCPSFRNIYERRYQSCNNHKRCYPLLRDLITSTRTASAETTTKMPKVRSKRVK